MVFKLADDRISVLIEIDPSGPPPDMDSVRSAFEISEFNDYFLVEEALGNALANLSKQGQSMEPLTAVVAQRRDAELKLDVAEDGLSATCSVTAAYHGRHVTTMDVAVAARKGGVTIGLVMHNIAELVRRARQAQPGDQVSEVIAEGKPPVNGKDAWLEQLAVTLKDRVL